MSKENQEETKELTRILNSVDMSDLERRELGVGELRDRAVQANSVYKDYLKQVIKLLIQKQLELVVTSARNEQELSFNRGTIKGLHLINEWFLEQQNIIEPEPEEEEI